MKILYITGAQGPDYLNDMVFHGLYSLLGNEVVDSKCLWYMYRSQVTPKKLRKLYGRGFSVYATLENDDIDRTDLERKIRTRYFDLVIYGSVHRCRDYLEAATDSYPASKIALLDGEDQAINQSLLFGRFPLFKRELRREQPNVFPITFSIPREKVADRTRCEKKQMFATCVPGDPTTYVFKDEQAYYRDYQASYFGMTKRKAGWDCLRHYEILANYCVPYFEDLESCPEATLAGFPKAECLEARALADGSFDENRYYELLDAMFSQLRSRLTTDKVARYLLDTMLRLA